MEERRESSRIELNHPISLQIEDDTLNAKLCNLSVQGALVALSEADGNRIDSSYLGLDASFLIKPKGQRARRYTGELIRFYFHADIPYLALRFWKPYVEV
jgi:hypothetical protein